MQPKDLEARVTALENDVAELRGQVQASREDSAAARVLAGGADRDVGELGKEMRALRRATISSFNALRQDMNDGFAEMRAKFDMTAAGQQRIAELIQTVVDNQGDDKPST